MKTFNSFDLAQYNFELPSELIAQYPLTNRAQAKMMVVDRERQMVSHDIFANIDQYLPPESMIVLNDSKVVPARLLAKRASGGEVEIFLLKKLI